MRHLPFWENQLIMISMVSLKQVLIRFSLKPLQINGCISSDDVSCGR